MDNLQTQFFKEKGIKAFNSQGESDIDYVQWLEEKLLSQPKDKAVGQSEQAEVKDKLPNDKDIQFGIKTFRNVQMASKVELILKPEHMNTVFTWKQIQDAIMNDGNDR